jgi:RNA polymerase sigma factor (sigma-70 family)
VTDENASLPGHRLAAPATPGVPAVAAAPGARAVNADDARFAELLRQYGGALGRVVAAYARPADQDDLAQEIAVALWNALPSFRGDCAEKTFVYRVAHNRALTHLARRRLRGGDELTDELAPVDGAPSPETRAAGRQEVARLYVAIRRLGVGYRQVLTLALEDLTHAEIGVCLGISAGNVAVRLNRARAALRAELEKP